MKTQGRFLWQNCPPGWVVSRSGVTSVGGGYFYVCPNLVSEFFGQNFFSAGQNFGGGLGYFYICPNVVSEFFGQNFFLASWKFWRGVLLCLSKSGVRIFWPKFFFSQLKILEGDTFTFLQKWPRNFFPTVGVPKYENFRMSWNIQICKNFWPQSILCWTFWAPKFWLSQLWLPFWPSYTYCLGPRFLLKLHILSLFTCA